MRVIINPEFDYYSDFIKSVPYIFDTEGTVIHQGRNTVKRFCVNDNIFIIKKYAGINIIQKLVYSMFRPSKAERAYLYANKLTLLGINTPKEVAYIELSNSALFHSGYFISLECSDNIVMSLSFNENFDRRLASAFASFLVELHSKNIYHGDLNLGNILYHADSDNNFVFSVIDTNRSTFKPLSLNECFDNMKRITHDRNLLKYITTEYARLRDLNQDKTVRTMIDTLDKFEKIDTFKRKLKRKRG